MTEDEPDLDLRVANRHGRKYARYTETFAGSWHLMLAIVIGGKMRRQNVSARTPWEDAFGYSRAVRIGNVVKVGGTIATDEDGTAYGQGDLYAQAAYIIRKLEKALREVGASLSNVVQTRSFMTDIDDWEGLAKAHSGYFGDMRPATSMIEISRLMTPEFLIEMEAEAVIEDD